MRHLHLLLLGLTGWNLQAGVGDPQLRTDHPWYPGELAMSTFERLFATQAEQYQRVTGITPTTDHDKALAAWFFRNTHFAHGEQGNEDLWGDGFSNSTKHTVRDYWTGFFAHGFALCGTTHAQWTAEIDALLGPCRSRAVGTKGHNSFEAFLTGGPYGTGHWAMLDHDLSTVIFDASGSALLGLDAISQDWQTLAKREHAPQRQNGWLVCGLHPGDGASYAAYTTAEYLAGYAGPPPIVHLRSGETLRRYFQPGLADGKTFVFWGRNYNTRGIPGPERSRTWVNQPEAMFQSQTGTTHADGQMRFANAVYTWQPNFTDGSYRDGLADESAQHVTLTFTSPYIIAATPANDQPWGIYDEGCKNGLTLSGNASCEVAVSVDRGTTWKTVGRFETGMDLTDHVKGHRQYQIRLGCSAAALATSQLTLTTVCQVNPATLPRLKDQGTRITYAASGQALTSFGPNQAQAAPAIIAGAFDSPKVTLGIATPHAQPIRTLYAAAHIASSSPPSPDVLYQIDYSLDAGRTWEPLSRDHRIIRQGTEPKDFWSQFLHAAQFDLPQTTASSVQIRFHNNGGKRYLRAEAHLAYPVPTRATRVTYAWTDSTGSHQQSRTLSDAATWDLPTADQVKTHWVEMTPE
jgi:hypothetical protein